MASKADVVGECHRGVEVRVIRESVIEVLEMDVGD